MIVEVYNLDEIDSKLLFVADTPYQAMEKLIYTLNWKHLDNNAKVKILGNGRTLSVLHNGATYSCVNRI